MSADINGRGQAKRRRGGYRVALVPVAAAVAAAAALAIFAVAGGFGGGSHHPATANGPRPAKAAHGKLSPGAPGVPAPPAGTAQGGSASDPGVSNIELSGSFLTIPVLGVHAPLVPTGAVGSPGTASLTIPGDVHTVAWWDGTVHDAARTVQEDAPKPGQPGVAVIAGHIDSAAAGPGALYNLKDLTTGDIIDITDSDGMRSTWTVSAPPDTTLKTELPPSLWVTTGPSKLALVTCGGPFDSSTGHYVDNVIVWATPATPT